MQRYRFIRLRLWQLKPGEVHPLGVVPDNARRAGELDHGVCPLDVQVELALGTLVGLVMLLGDPLALEAESGWRDLVNGGVSEGVLFPRGRWHSVEVGKV